MKANNYLLIGLVRTLFCFQMPSWYISYVLSFSAECLCLVDGRLTIVPPIIPEEQEFVHFNDLWCYLFYKLSGEEKDDKGIAAFTILPACDKMSDLFTGSARMNALKHAYNTSNQIKQPKETKFVKTLNFMRWKHMKKNKSNNGRKSW